MAKYVPSPRDWVREQVELYENSGGTYERSRLWKLAIAAYPPYAEYQERTARRIPVFVAERS